MNGGVRQVFLDGQMPSLSLVIPAYNEAHVLQTNLEITYAYFSSQSYPCDLIVVDDGSTDATHSIALSFAASRDNVRVISIPHGGKAAALRAGMRAASGDLVAFTDADLATPLSYLDLFRDAIAGGCNVVIGSREGGGARRVGEPFYRHIMGRVFNGIVRLLLLPGIQDTQCGFKLFQREALSVILDGALLYARAGANVVGPRVTAFDVEMLVVARRQGYRICTVPVVWTYGTHSKVSPAKDTWHNLRDVLHVKVNDRRGRYNSRRT